MIGGWSNLGATLLVGCLAGLAAAQPIINSNGVFPTSGPTAGGTEITITGQDFGASGVVVINGMNAPLLSYTDTLIQAVSPPGVGLNRAVRVVRGDGVASAPYFGFSYYAPNITSISPQVGPPAGGTTVTLHGSDFGPSGTVLIGSALAPVQFYDDREIRVWTPPGTGINRPVAVIQSGGQIGASCCFSYHPLAGEDCNTNGTDDGEEAFQPGDMNGNWRIDGEDYRLFTDCLTGPCTLSACSTPIYADACCAAADFDSDGDVDVRDAGAFKALLVCPAGRELNLSDPDAPLCVQCQPGHASPGFPAAECVACGPGRFAPVAGASECLLCPPGDFASTNGAASCDPCPAGSAINTNGATACDACSNGHYAPEAGSVECLPCGPGTYASGEGSIQCVQCEEGSFVNTNGASACLPCPAGTANDERGRTECEPCTPGRYAPGIGFAFCEPCPYGTAVNTNGATVCLPCAPGSANHSTGATECAACTSGYFAPSPGMFDCSPCPAGTAVNSNGATNCDACSNGLYQPSLGQDECLPCPPGSRAPDVGAMSCDACPEGTVQPFYGGAECWECLEHAAANMSQTACTCDLGYYQHCPPNGTPEGYPCECLECPPGAECEQGCNEPICSHCMCIASYWQPPP